MDARADDATLFEATWQRPRGFVGWLSEVNNQPLGKRYMLTSLVFFAVGGAMALILRLQLVVSENRLIDPQLFNELFTMHGSTMMFLFAVPFLEGLALYLLPMMIGSRDVAFPRLTAFSYWTYLFGGLIFYASFLFGTVPDAGWFAYTPLSGPRFAGKELDFWLLGLGLVEIAGLTAGIEIVATILKFRAPGMSIGRMPLFVWAMLATGVMILFAFTVLLTATLMLELDRTLGTHFFSAEQGAGGSSLLWQHLFWFFGHPEVYIMFLPAAGIVSMVVPVFSRRRMAGYVLVVVAILITAFLSFGLWVHHMYTTGLPTLSMNFFAAASLMIAVASGIQVFAWIATMWGSRPALTTPMLFVLGFLFIFVLGGMTGVMIAIVPFNWQVHDTYFIVAHFHYVLIGGVVFPIMAAVHYWGPKVTGKLLSARLGKWSFWLTFAGFNATFFPMHVMGMLGMPRRVFTYSSVLQLDAYNVLATAGAFVLAAGFLLIFYNLIRSLRLGAPAGDDPFGGDSLEWSVSSPPPSYSFGEPPRVLSRHALWPVADPGPQEHEDELRARQALTFAPAHFRATLVTDAVEARPQAIQHLPGPTHVPLFTAVGLLASATGVLLEHYLTAIAATLFTCGSIVNWLRPDRDLLLRVTNSRAVERARLPGLPTGSRSVGWWGALGFLVCYGTSVLALIYSYFFLRLFSAEWPQGAIGAPELGWPALAAGALVLAVVGQALAARRSRSHVHSALVQICTIATPIMGALFLALHIHAQKNLGFAPSMNAYASAFWVIGWMVDLIVLVAISSSILLNLSIARESRSEEQTNLPLQMQICSMLWYSSLGVGAVAFATLYGTPHLLRF